MTWGDPAGDLWPASLSMISALERDDTEEAVAYVWRKGAMEVNAKFRRKYPCGRSTHSQSGGVGEQSF